MANQNPNVSTNLIPPMPVMSPMIDKNGMITMAWNSFFQALITRLGGLSASTNAEINAQLSALQTGAATSSTSILDLNQGTTL